MARVSVSTFAKFAITLILSLTLYIGHSINDLQTDDKLDYQQTSIYLKNTEPQSEGKNVRNYFIHNRGNQKNPKNIVMNNNNIAAKETKKDEKLQKDNAKVKASDALNLKMTPRSKGHGIPLEGQRRNVLMIIADDMRPDIGAYKDTMPPEDWIIKTPVLDELAKRSLILKQAHVQQAVCSPSRASFLTSRRPDTTGVYDLKTYFRESGGDFTTLPQYFKENGYNTIGLGKIFHEQVAASGHNQDEEKSWNLMDPKFFLWNKLQSSMPAYGNFTRMDIEKLGKKTSEEQVTLAGEELISSLGKEWTDTGKNFFLAIGYRRPHLPFMVPEEYAKMYPAENVSLASNRYPAAFMPTLAWQKFSELRQFNPLKNYTGKWGTHLAENHQIELRRHYFAAITWIDSLIGRLMQALNANEEVRKSTVIAFLGDHGWHLGEHAMWCKFTNFDIATRAPLFIAIPGITDRGINVTIPTEFVDLYPTLVEAAGLPGLTHCPVESKKVNLCTEGESLLPLIENPDGPQRKNIAFSQYPRKGIMGYSLRTPRYRYTEWIAFAEKSPNGTSRRQTWKANFGTELYDHDFDYQENVNLASFTAYRNIIIALSEVLRAGWRDAPKYARAVEKLKPTGNKKRIKIIIDLSKVHSQKAMATPPVISMKYN